MAVHLVPDPGEVIDRAGRPRRCYGRWGWPIRGTQKIVVTRWPVSWPGTRVAIALNAQWAAARLVRGLPAARGPVLAALGDVDALASAAGRSSTDGVAGWPCVITARRGGSGRQVVVCRRGSHQLRPIPSRLPGHLARDRKT